MFGVVVSERNEKRMYILLIKPPNIHTREREREKKKRILFLISMYIFY